MTILLKICVLLSLMFPSASFANADSLQEMMYTFCITLGLEIKKDPDADIEKIRKKIPATVMPADDIFNAIYFDNIDGFTKRSPAAQLNCEKTYEAAMLWEPAGEADPEPPPQVKNAMDAMWRVSAVFQKKQESAMEQSQRRAAAISEPVMDDCEVVRNYELCKNTDVSEFERLINNAKLALLPKPDKKARCGCLAQSLNHKYGFDQEGLQKKKAEQLEKLKKAAVKQISKKFLNDYAAHVENVSFYSARIPRFFGHSPSEQSDAAKDLQCSDSKRYEDAINKKCGGKLSQEQLQEKLDDVFNVFGGMKPNTSLEKKLLQLNHKVSVLDGKTLNSEGNLYTRFDHDRIRFSLSKTNPEYKFIDQLVKKVMLDNEIFQQVKHSDLSPFETISREVNDLAKANPTAFIKKYLNEQEMGSELFKEFRAVLTDPDKIKSNNIFQSSISTAMGIHPGFETIMQDKDLFLKVVKSAGNGKSLTAVLEEKNPGLFDKFKSDCEELTKKLAEAACLDEDSIPKMISSRQAVGILNIKDGDGNKDIVRHLMCEAESPEHSKTLFKNLLFADVGEKKSDFLDRMLFSPDKQTNSFQALKSSFEKDKDSTLHSQIRESLSQTAGMGQSVGGDSLVSNQFGSKIQSSAARAIIPQLNEEISPIRQMKTDAVVSNAVQPQNQSHAQSSLQEPVQKIASTQQFMSAANFVPETQASVPQTEQKIPKDIRKEFREFLSNEQNKEDVDKLISNSDDGMMKDLMKLREEYSKNQTRLSELTNETHKLKLKSMEEEIKKTGRLKI